MMQTCWTNKAYKCATFVVSFVTRCRGAFLEGIRIGSITIKLYLQMPGRQWEEWVYTTIQKFPMSEQDWNFSEIFCFKFLSRIIAEFAELKYFTSSFNQFQHFSFLDLLKMRHFYAALVLLFIQSKDHRSWLLINLRTDMTIVKFHSTSQKITKIQIWRLFKFKIRQKITKQIFQF